MTTQKTVYVNITDAFKQLQNNKIGRREIFVLCTSSEKSVASASFQLDASFLEANKLETLEINDSHTALSVR